MAAINATRNALIALTPGAVGVSNTVAPVRTGTTGAFPAGGGTTTKFADPYLSSTPPAAGNVINVIELGAGDFNTSTTCTKIQLEGNENSIFVLKRGGNSALNFGASSGNPTHCGVQVELIGVDPNNVFWAVNANISWNRVSSAAGQTHIMTGTFLTDNTGTPKWETVVFDGGRLLGPNGVPSTTNFTPGTTKVIAIGNNGQPLLAPVLQLQVPTGAPAADTTRRTTAPLNLPANITIGQVRATKWLAKAAGETKFNLVAGAGDTPARPTEDNGGLHNFLRFLETWNATEVEAFGSFVQYKRSVFATAPFQPLLATNTSTGLFGYPQVYSAANGGGTLPFYEPPDRNWGFDVALLKQRRPDLLAERFSTEPIFSANEFFRETSRDDKWVQALLCAKTVSTSSNAINNTERPTNCDVIAPGTNW